MVNPEPHLQKQTKNHQPYSQNNFIASKHVYKLSDLKKKFIVSTNLVPKNVISFPLNNLFSSAPNSGPLIYFKHISLKNHPKARMERGVYAEILYSHI